MPKGVSLNKTKKNYFNLHHCHTKLRVGNIDWIDGNTSSLISLSSACREQLFSQRSGKIVALNGWRLFNTFSRTTSICDMASWNKIKKNAFSWTCTTSFRCNAATLLTVSGNLCRCPKSTGRFTPRKLEANLQIKQIFKLKKSSLVWSDLIRVYLQPKNTLGPPQT